MSDRNDCVLEILKYSYEFDRAVARPEEAADWFTERLYVPTLLDTKLREDIKADCFDLVLLTGNPGDGKSAFMRQFLPDGSTLTADGRTLHVRHDATEPTDPSDRTASALNDLEEFLRPLLDEHWDPEAVSSQMFLVGINKGLLVRAFLSRNTRFGLLSTAVRESLEQKMTSMASSVRVRVVDLNDRSEVTLPEVEEASLFDAILDRLVCEKNWEDAGCSDCCATDWCPFIQNARWLRDDGIRSRMRLLWLVQQLEGDRHTTLRDLLAGLSYVLVGHADMFHQEDDPRQPLIHPCEFVENEMSMGSFGPLARRLLYNSTFVDGDIFAGPIGSILETDSVSDSTTFGMAPAVIGDQVNSLDPNLALSTPHWDAVEDNLIKNPTRALGKLQKEAQARGSLLECRLLETAQEAFDAFDEDLDREESTDADYRRTMRLYNILIDFLVDLVKRRHFFLGADGDAEWLTPYASLSLFLNAIRYLTFASREHLDAYDNILRKVLPSAIHHAERVPQADRPEELKVRYSAGPSAVGAVLVLLSSAELDTGPPRDCYVEHFPQYLVYDPGIHGTKPLRLSLKAFEGVFQLSRGYSDGFQGVPRSSQFANFRDTLRGQPSSRLTIVDASDSTASVTVSLGARMRFE